MKVDEDLETLDSSFGVVGFLRLQIPQQIFISFFTSLQGEIENQLETLDSSFGVVGFLSLRIPQQPIPVVEPSYQQW